MRFRPRLEYLDRRDLPDATPVEPPVPDMVATLTMPVRSEPVTMTLAGLAQVLRAGNTPDPTTAQNTPVVLTLPGQTDSVTLTLAELVQSVQPIVLPDANAAVPPVPDTMVTLTLPDQTAPVTMTLTDVMQGVGAGSLGNFIGEPGSLQGLQLEVGTLQSLNDSLQLRISNNKAATEALLKDANDIQKQIDALRVQLVNLPPGSGRPGAIVVAIAQLQLAQANVMLDIFKLLEEDKQHIEQIDVNNARISEILRQLGLQPVLVGTSVNTNLNGEVPV